MATRREFNRIRQSWMAAFERGVIQSRPDRAGRIDWDTAAYLFNSHNSPEDAAAKYLRTLSPGIRKMEELSMQKRTADAHRYTLVRESDGVWLVLYRDHRGCLTTLFSGDVAEAEEYFEECTLEPKED